MSSTEFNRKTRPAFRYRDRGSMATVGRGVGVVDLKWVRFAGWFGWITWLFVHLLYIVQIENRLLILIQWAWNYFTRNRSARLITDQLGPMGDGFASAKGYAEHDPAERRPSEDQPRDTTESKPC